MGREIDERVVQMKFENGQFEKGISTSIRSMEELKKGMDFDDAVKGFNKLDAAAKGLKLEGLSAGVEAVRVKFDLLQITAFNVLNRISNKAIDTGERMVKGLSIDQVAVGWDKFASKTASVQTIMAATASQFSNTSEQMGVVNEQLDKLNWFTDETSYNFVDMVNNIGKFTSNNIDLKTSVTAMQGIANWAAISGANANEASRAMYNLSQALSTGSVKLIDWKSIENANMATAEFKKTVIEMAAAEGTLKKKSEDTFTTLDGKVEISTKTFKGFNDSLQKGWFNTNVLMKSLDRYGGATNKLNKYYEETGLLTSELVSGIDDFTAGTKTAEQISKEWGQSLEKTQEILQDFNSEQDQFGLKAFKAAQEAKTFEDAINSVKDAVSTGWMKSFEYIFGDYLEAKEFFTDLANVLYDIFAAGGEQRNEILSGWKDLGGRDMFIDSIWNALALVLAILKPIQLAWNDVFGEMTSDRLLSITASLQTLMDSLASLAENNMPKVERAFRGVFSVVDILASLIRAFIMAVGRVTVSLFPFMDGVLGTAASFGDLLYNLDSVIQESKIFDRVFGSIADVLIRCINAVRTFTKAVAELIFGAEKVDDFGIAMVHPFDLFEEILVRFSNISFNVANTINRIVDAFQNGGVNMERFSEIFKEALSALSDPFNDGFLNGALDIVNSGLFAALIFQLKKFVKNLGGFDITKIFKNFKNAFTELGETIGAFEANINAKTLQIIATAILTLAAALLVLASINPERLTGALGAITVLFAELAVSMAAFQKIFSGKFSLKITKISTLMIGMSAALLILSSALTKLSEIDSEALQRGLAATVALISSLAISLKLLSSETKQIRGGSVLLISLSAAINILAIAVEKLGLFNVDQLITGLSSIGILLGELALFMFAISNSNITLRSSIALLSISSALVILSDTVAAFSLIPISGLAVAASAIGMLLAEIGIFMAYAGKAKGLLTLSISLNVMSGAIVALSAAVVQMSSLALQDALNGVIGIGGALGVVGLAIRAFPKNALSVGISIAVVAGSLQSILGTIMLFTDLENVAKGLGAVGVSLVAIGVGLRVIPKNGLIATATLISFAGALYILSPALKLFSEVGVVNLVATLGGLIVSFAALSAVAAALRPMAPALRSLSATIAIFSASVLALGVGVTMLSTGLVSLGGAAVIGVGGLSVALLEIIKLIPTIIREIGVGIVALADVIAEGAPRIANAFVALVIAGLDAISETVPEIVDRLLEIFQKIIATLIARIPSLGDALSELFRGASVEGFKEFAIALSLILGSIIASMKVLQRAKGISAGALVTLSIMIGAATLIALMLAQFSKMVNPASVIPLATSISEVFIALGIAMRVAGDSANGTQINKATLISVSALIGVIGLVLGAFSGMTDPVSVIPLATGISELLIALSAALKILSDISGDLSSGINLRMFGILAIIVSGLGVVIALLSNITNPVTVVPLATALSMLLLAIAGVVKVISTIDVMSMAMSIKVLGIMGIVIGALGALTVAIGALMQLPGFTEILQNGAEGMRYLGQAIGGFFGGVIGGFAGGVLSFLPSLGTYLSEFMTNANYFFATVGKIPDGIGSKVAGLAAALIALGAADLLTSIMNFAKFMIGEKGNDLPSKFKAFGGAISAFGRSLGDDFDANKVEAAANAGKALADLENTLPRHGGKLQDWLGDKDLSQFGIRIMIFGTAIRNFGFVVKDLDVDAVTAATNAGMALANLENTLPAQDGILQAWLGSKSLDDFGNRIVLFGRGIKIFSVTVKGINPTDVETAVAAGQLLAGLEENVPPQDGMLQKFLGSSNIGDFGSRLFQFGLGLKLFSTAVTGLNIEAITAATEASAALVKMEADVDKTGGWGELFTGKSDFSSFGENLKGLGSGLVSFNTSISTISLDKITQTTDAVEDIVAIGNTPSAAFEGLKTLSGSIQAFAPSIGILDANTATADPTAMAAVTAEIERLLRLSELTDASTWIRDIVAHANKMVSSLTSTLKKKQVDLYNAGKNAASWIIRGIVVGLQNNQKYSTYAAIEVAQAIQTAVENTLGIASPSTVMIEEGHWVVKGLAEGIKSDMSAEEAAAKKASNIVTAFQTVLDQIDLMAKNRELKSGLWEVTEGVNATDEEWQARQMEEKSENLKDAAERVKVNQAAFETAKQNFADGSKEYIEAENRMLESMKQMYEIKNEIDELQKALFNTAGDSMRSNNAAYVSYIKENKEAYKMMGWITDDNMDRLIEDAKKKTGFGMPVAEQKGKIDTDAIVNAALGPQTVDIVIEKVSAKTSDSVTKGVTKGLSDAGNAIAGNGSDSGKTGGIGDAVVDAVEKSFKGSGLDRVNNILGAAGLNGADNFGSGFTNAMAENAPQMIQSVSNAGEQAKNALFSALGEHSPSVYSYQAGEYLCIGLSNGVSAFTPQTVATTKYLGEATMDGLTNGILERGQQAIAAAEQIANSVANIMAGVLGIASPSKLTRSYGNYLDEGLVLGMRDKMSNVEDSSYEVAGKTLTALDYAKDRINDIMQSDDDFSPTITPVLNMDEIKKQGKQLGRTFGRSTLDLQSARLQVGSIADQTAYGQNGSKGVGNQTNYNFVQNNYSPKALNRSEIYRQTNNQFSRLKGASQR